MIVRIVRMTFKEDHVADFLKFFDNVSFKIRRMDGCHHLELMKDTRDPNSFITYSLWEDDEKLDKYRKSEEFGEIWAETKEFFSEKPVAFSMKRYLTVE